MYGLDVNNGGVVRDLAAATLALYRVAEWFCVFFLAGGGALRVGRAIVRVV